MSSNSHFNENVIYLEQHDLEGSKLSPQILEIANQRPVLVMIQAGFCGHCQDAKPEFQKCADNNTDILHCTIVSDGSDSEQGIAQDIGSKVEQYDGVPTFMLFSSDGSHTATHDGERSEKAFKDFCVSNQ